MRDESEKDNRAVRSTRKMFGAENYLVFGLFFSFLFSLFEFTGG
jgi:hypothetical protein